MYNGGLAALLAAIGPVEPVQELVRDNDSDGAVDRAYAAGIAAGEARALGGLALDRDLITTLCGALTQAQTIDRSALALPFAALATRLAEAVLNAELTLSPSIVARLVEEALAAVEVDEPFTLRLHPDDVAAVAAVCPLPAVAVAGQPRGSVEIDGPRFVVRDGLAARLAVLVEQLG